MFAKAAIALVSLSALSAAVPVSIPRRDLNARSSHFEVQSSHPLSGWGGHESLNGFDDFYGAHNFDSSRNTRHVLVNESHLVCHTHQVEIIQQKLVVLQELAKKIITEQICEVESQTVVLEQWRSSIRGFHYDLNRHEGRTPGYDSHIASKYNELFEHDGSLSTHDLGFKGSDVGSNYIVPEGSTWNQDTSPSSVESAYKNAEAARDSTSALPPITQDQDDDNSDDNGSVNIASAPADGDNSAPPADGDNTAIASDSADAAASVAPATAAPEATNA